MSISKLGPHFLHWTINIGSWRTAAPRSMKHFGTWGAAQPGDGLNVGIRSQQPMDAKGFFESGYGPQQAADIRFNHNLPGYLADQAIDVWEFDNELSFETKRGREWYTEYSIANMMLFESIGKKAAIFSFAVGNPEPNEWPDYLPALQYARDNGHYLALHEYMTPMADLGVGWNQLSWQQHLRDNPSANFDQWKANNPGHWFGRRDSLGAPDESYPYGWGVLRYRYLYDHVLRPLGLNNLPLLITETGCDIIGFTPQWWGHTGSWKANIPLWQSWGITNPEHHFADMLIWYDQRLQEDSYVQAAHIFTVGHVPGTIWEGWEIANTGVEQRILQYISSAQPPPPPPPPPPPLPDIRIVKKPQINDMTRAENQLANEWAWENYGRTTTHSVDDMIRMLSGGDPNNSYAIVAWPYRNSQQAALDALNAGGYEWIVMPGTDPPTPPLINLIYRPCQTTTITQLFGVNPHMYPGLPGHDGLDYGVAKDHPFYAAATGVCVHASDRRWTSNTPSPYGWHVVLDHGDYCTVYAHARPDLPVQVGQAVVAGQIVGWSGNTGQSTGYHLHFGLLDKTGTIDPGNGFPNWLHGRAVNPLPFVQNLPAPPLPPPPPTTVDLLTYIMGDGRRYPVLNSGGSQEMMQTKLLGNKFYQSKNNNWEQMWVEGNYIIRDTDISPGGGRFYRLIEGGNFGSRWIPRYWTVGQEWVQSRYVQFYHLNNCTPSAPNSGGVIDTMRFVDRYNSYTFRTGYTLPDVVKLLWVNGGEFYFYARNYGLVAWERQHQDPNTPQWSAINGPPDGNQNDMWSGCFGPTATGSRS